jgi:hypothetical protein
MYLPCSVLNFESITSTFIEQRLFQKRRLSESQRQPFSAPCLNAVIQTPRINCYTLTLCFFIPRGFLTLNHKVTNSRRLISCLKSWPSNLFMKNGHTRYCGLVSRVARGKMTISGMPNCLNYCGILIGYT